MENVELEKKLINERTRFHTLLGEAHILYGVIENELKKIWHVASYKNKVAKPEKIERKWKKVQKMTLGQIIEEVDYLSVCPDNNIVVLKDWINPERNYLTHKIQNIIYNDKRLTQSQNKIKITHDLSKAALKISRQNKTVKMIARDLNRRRLLLEKQIGR